MKSKKIRFLVKDNRVGMAHKILSALATKNMNILAMEITPPYISVKVSWDFLNWEDFKKDIKEEIKEILDIIELDMMDSEKVAKELQIIINSMEDGIIAVNKSGKIEYYNSKAAKLFGIFKGDQNKHINFLIPKEIYNPTVDINDKSSIEVSGKIRNKKVNLILDVKMIKNEVGIKLGALLIFREMDEVRRLIQTISRPSMISFDDIIGESKSLKETISIAKSVSKTEANIMILGESGTGKELFARAIHLNSNRANGPFVAVNCSAVPETLLESEFFGYDKGAFTGANRTGKQGLFELATGGSIFLDEIGDLPTHLQAKILRAIQEKCIRRIGGEKEISIDVRIISATHRNLSKMVIEKTFREDLYYRLNVIPVNIPPLRERKEDILLLVRHFIKVLGENEGKSNIKITDNAINELKKYSWPGNVRELQNVIERALIFAEDTIDVEHLLINTKPTHNLIESLIQNEDDINLPVKLPVLLEKIEYDYIIKAKEKFKSSREIAKALGISHTTVINRMRKYEKSM
ncbi:sigma 54-interacting transcriptional regulator [Tissierella sp. MSJ-40]|uniref:HTH-type transcriptional regulatory protein TyrR n=1 Tax=Tissierella simiarum TaxID=2841534 RepID=A0ABS6E2Y3_9FIRM|nr:sigma 54-interacting transcriptional regulator [Tissierella simiarum]MBU5437268.1 sigma 54-interacting transcriptional regulator [Tissierella simiarum]